MQKKSIEDIYQKKDLHQHILDRPDTYIGSIKNVCDDQYVFVNGDSGQIQKKTIEYNPALIKIFDEILVNAIDHTVRDNTATFIKIDIDKKTNTISVHNNGKGIPIVIHKEQLVYIPEMIFGQLLTSSNYNDSQNRIVGGVNGLGSKACNVYSTFFSIETIDEQRELYYYQEFSNNMFNKTNPIIKKCKKKSYTKITFIPDFARFKLKNLTDDIISLMIKRVYDCTACTNKNVNVYFNGEKLKQKDFQHYISLFTKEKIIYEKFEYNDFIWEYAINTKPSDNFEQISFVNGIATTQGGRHVDYILNQIVKKLLEIIQNKKKIDNIKPSYIKDKLQLFVRSTIVNPSFSSQTKELLTTPIKDFGCKVEVSEQFISKIYKSGIVEEIISFTKYKNNRELLKTTTDTRNKVRLRIDKLDDANNAGTKKSKDCTLFLTEGLSAKTFAMSGLSVIGRDNYGVFALKGKVINIREASQKQLVSNEEINNLKQIIGLQHGKKYTSVDTLRYGSICILTDQDLDGSHIRCLLVNMFHTWWPELLDIKGFITSMKTPIVKVSNGNKHLPFYTLKDFKDWENNIENIKSWNVKYYKGLGTSTPKEAKDIFKLMHNNIIKYISPNKNETDLAITLAFEKKQADSRKNWLKSYNFDMVLDQANSDVSYTDLINKELIHFSMYDVLRSIPSICDGLKPSQRKVIYTLFKKNYKKEIKVAQLGAAVAETTSYHHGEQSLYGTIVNLAQNYTGSNNINLLKPNGQFGSRLNNGRDAASPRYIYTELSNITTHLFHTHDNHILNYLQDDGQSIEPIYYVPILPIVLLNGAQGIGTGYSTNIPCFNPNDVVLNIKNYLNGKPLKKFIPWYNGFTGNIIEDENNNFLMKGVYHIVNDTSLKITDIPVGISIDDYKDFLDSLIDDNKYGIVNFKNNSTETIIDFTLKFNNKNSLNNLLSNEDIYKYLKLTKNISTKNFHLLNQYGSITKYDNAEDILISFVKLRLEFNQKRKSYLIDTYSLDLNILNNKIRFLTEIINGDLIVYKKSKNELNDILLKKSYNQIDDTYNYLISMPIYSFTNEKLDDLYKKKNTLEYNLKEIQNKNIKTLLIEDLDSVTF
jgi:DNA topoisomerase II